LPPGDEFVSTSRFRALLNVIAVLLWTAGAILCAIPLIVVCAIPEMLFCLVAVGLAYVITNSGNAMIVNESVRARTAFVRCMRRFLAHGYRNRSVVVGLCSIVPYVFLIGISKYI
jgi:hypothetical protein